MKDGHVILAVIAVAVILILGYNFLGQIKVGPLNLVPSGSTAAVNPNSQTAVNASIIGQAAGNAAAANSAAAQAASGAQAGAFGALGAGIGALITNSLGSNTPSDTEAQ